VSKGIPKTIPPTTKSALSRSVRFSVRRSFSFVSLRPLKVSSTVFEIRPNVFIFFKSTGRTVKSYIINVNTDRRVSDRTTAAISR